VLPDCGVLLASFVVVLLHKPAAPFVGFVFLVEDLEAGIIAHTISLDESWEVQDQESGGCENVK
jgi:hypothetical protein